ncbi:MAG: hypothetical protein ACFCUS_08200, partial [Rubrimonas sp.]
MTLSLAWPPDFADPGTQAALAAAGLALLLLLWSLVAARRTARDAALLAERFGTLAEATRVEIPTKSDTISDLKSDAVSDLKPDIIPRSSRTAWCRALG